MGNDTVIVGTGNKSYASREHWVDFNRQCGVNNPEFNFKCQRRSN
ncbi:MAG: hypothetical protein EOP48_00790 [Sphingobacteriales bacterium]|nr:MAG: hypothetical protein EOP48_00790 [Sphingobacteriales bacterium]